jgi:uncharacterized protein
MKGTLLKLMEGMGDFSICVKHEELRFWPLQCLGVYPLLISAARLDHEAAPAIFSRNSMLVVLAALPLLAAYILLKEAVLRVIWRHRGATPRSLIVGAIMVLFVFAAAGLYARFIEPDWVRRCTYMIETTKWEADRKVRLAHLSDLHIEQGSEIRLKRSLGILSRERPDLIVLTGDYSNDNKAASLEILGGFTADLARIAPVYAVGGNWDSVAIMQFMEARGVRFLQGRTLDMAVRGARLRLIGSDSSRSEALQMILKPDSSSFLVVLAHTPRLFEASSHSGADLYLCGHTHGGQIRLPLFGTICPYYELVGKYQLGEYRFGSTTMIVNGGIGMEGGRRSLSVRFWDRPQVGIIEIRGK